VACEHCRCTEVADDDQEEEMVAVLAAPPPLMADDRGLGASSSSLRDWDGCRSSGARHDSGSGGGPGGPAIVQMIQGTYGIMINISRAEQTVPDNGNMMNEMK
jgi:hypothetical protein